MGDVWVSAGWIRRFGAGRAGWHVEECTCCLALISEAAGDSATAFGKISRADVLLKKAAGSLARRLVLEPGCNPMALPDTHIPIPAKDWWLNLLLGAAIGIGSGIVSGIFLEPIAYLFLAPSVFWYATWLVEMHYAMDAKWGISLLFPIYIAIQWGVAWLLYFDSLTLAAGMGGAAVLLSVAVLLKAHRQWRTALWCLLALVLVLAVFDLGIGWVDRWVLPAAVIAWQMIVLAGIAAMLLAAHGRRRPEEGPGDANIPSVTEAE
jgi:hypothetical protein